MYKWLNPSKFKKQSLTSSSFTSNRNNVKKKHSFSLLEVVIAISVCMMSFGLLFRATSQHMHKQLITLKQIEAQRLLELSYFDILDTWIQKGRFDNCKIELPSFQKSVFSNEPITFERLVTLGKTSSKTSTQHEQWKKLTFQVTYPQLKTSAKYYLLLHQSEPKSL
ncbi:MAG: hypothetical protein KDK44_01835 [Chlamydiia bacterium]|nr:hypothetical protein [Chlamydiia bacterium]MCP5509528.1 hypothetical protein [Chlamydiales bacterium]